MIGKPVDLEIRTRGASAFDRVVVAVEVANVNTTQLVGETCRLYYDTCPTKLLVLGDRNIPQGGLLKERAPMARWSFEPGHTAAEFCVRHMMVTHVRGHFKNVHGTLEFDPGVPEASRVEATIDTRGLWSGEPDRDAHLRSSDFLDVEHFPEMTFTSSAVRLMSPNEALVTGALTIRGVTKPVTLDVHYLGQWETPWWEDGVDKGPKTRAGFVATARIDRHDFGVSWNSLLARGGIVVGHQVLITIDAEAILES